ncbi:MAG: hypothetical protein KC492_36330 [Myxococcales bacterium]|nr:hypothetical protein [Myxococcales bacterium]
MALGKLGISKLREITQAEAQGHLDYLLEVLCSVDPDSRLSVEATRVLEEWRTEAARDQRRALGAPQCAKPHRCFTLVHFALIEVAREHEPERTDVVNLGKMLRIAERVWVAARHVLTQSIVEWALGDRHELRPLTPREFLSIQQGNAAIRMRNP